MDGAKSFSFRCDGRADAVDTAGVDLTLSFRCNGRAADEVKAGVDLTFLFRCTNDIDADGRVDTVSFRVTCCTGAIEDDGAADAALSPTFRCKDAMDDDGCAEAALFPNFGCWGTSGTTSPSYTPWEARIVIDWGDNERGCEQGVAVVLTFRFRRPLALGFLTIGGGASGKRSTSMISATCVVLFVPSETVPDIPGVSLTIFPFWAGGSLEDIPSPLSGEKLPDDDGGKRHEKESTQ